MQLANFENDYWQLRNGEESHDAQPDTFWIPPLDQRKSLKIGDAAKVSLDIECEDEDGQIFVEGERGYVIVSEIVGDQYIGILDFQPLCIEKDQDDVYLCFGAEVPFGPEHIIDIDQAS